MRGNLWIEYYAGFEARCNLKTSSNSVKSGRFIWGKTIQSFYPKWFAENFKNRQCAEVNQLARNTMHKNNQEKIRYAIAELVEKGDLEIVNEIFATDYIAHAREKEYSGHSFIKRFANQLRTAIPDIHLVDVKFLAQEGRSDLYD